jgi:hypothetical protein
MKRVPRRPEPEFHNQKNRGWTQINTDEADAKNILSNGIHLGGEALFAALNSITHLSVFICVHLWLNQTAEIRFIRG